MMNHFFIHNSIVLMFIILDSCKYWDHMCYLCKDKLKLSFLKFPYFFPGANTDYQYQSGILNIRMVS